MAAVELENRTGRLFGREADLERFLQRTRRTGLTAIIGQPQIGKSWLLTELARRLDRETDPRFLVGFTRSPKGAPDPLLQVVGDLYQRWLADAGARQQIETVWEQQKDRLLPAFARFVGKLSEKAGKIFPIAGELGGAAIKEALEGLVVASEDLRTGRLTVSRLEYTQAQELVSSVRNIAGRWISLVMDQWEETRDLDQQRNVFRDFLREPEQWPDCHILLSAREESHAAELLRELEREFPSGACVHILSEMHLDAKTERRRLISFLRRQPQLRAIENVDDKRVLNLVGGYPRVISRWVAEDARETVRTFEGIEHLAQEANKFRYSDLEKLLLNLDGDRLTLAVRMALVPLTENLETWRALNQVIFAGLDRSALGALRRDNILERNSEAPSFGHLTRRDAAERFLYAQWQEVVSAEADGLIMGLVRWFSSSTTRGGAYSSLSALVGLRDDAMRLNLGPLSLGLCEAACSLLHERLPSPASLIDGAREARRSCKPGVGPILAGAIGNALVDAWSDGDLARRDSLLDELRQLALAYPDDANVRAQLAEGLLSTLFKATAEKDLVRREVLLDELRALARAYPDDTTVRDQLAQGLCSRLVDAEEEGDLARCDALLDELRALSRVNPDDAGLRRELAVGLVFTLLGAAPGEDAARRVLLEELGLLASSYPDELEGWLANLRALTESSADLAAMQELFGGLKGD